MFNIFWRINCVFNYYLSVVAINILGPGIKKNFNMNQTFVSNRDLAITAMNALGLNKGEYMTGRILEEAYEKNTCLENAARKERFQTIVFLAIFCTIHVWLLAWRWSSDFYAWTLLSLFSECQNCTVKVLVMFCFKFMWFL